MNHADKLKALYGDDYFSRIRQQRKTPSKGTFQNLTPEERRELALKGLKKRWNRDA